MAFVDEEPGHHQAEAVRWSRYEYASANMRWSVDEAIRAARGLSEFAVYWLEEPTIPDDVEGHRRIVRDRGLDLPITSHGAHDITIHLLAAVPNRS